MRSVEHRVIAAAMSELELAGLRADRPRQQLMTQADPEVWHACVEQLADDIEPIVEIGRIAGSRRDDHAVRLQRRDIGERRAVRHDRHLARRDSTSERTMFRLTPQSSTTTCGPLVRR